MVAIDVRIDPEFRDVLPPLPQGDRAKLEQSILTEGCRDPLVVWSEHGVLVDGHNRYEICRKHNVQYSLHAQSFASRDDVIVWIISNQLHRRNLSDLERIRLAEHVAPMIEAKAKANQGTRTDISQNSAKCSPVDTRAELAKIAGVSHDTYHKGKKILQGGAKELVDAVSKGDVSINAASALTELPEPEQAKLVNEGSQAVKKAVVAINAHKTAARRKQKAMTNSSIHHKVLEKAKERPIPQAAPCYAQYAERLEKMPIRRVVNVSRFDADAFLYWTLLDVIKSALQQTMNASGLRSPVGMGPLMLTISKLSGTVPPETWVVCKNCEGTGSKHGICQSCNGSGYRNSNY